MKINFITIMKIMEIKILRGRKKEDEKRKIKVK
jgi:hypothetical protein